MAAANRNHLRTGYPQGGQTLPEPQATYPPPVFGPVPGPDSVTAPLDIIAQSVVGRLKECHNRLDVIEGGPVGPEQPHGNLGLIESLVASAEIAERLEERLGMLANRIGHL